MAQIASADRTAMNALYTQEMKRYGKTGSEAFKNHGEFMTVLAAAVEDPDAKRDHEKDIQTFDAVISQDKKTKGSSDPNDPIKD